MVRTFFLIITICLLALNMLKAQNLSQSRVVHTNLRNISGYNNPHGYTDAMSFNFDATTSNHKTTLKTSISKFMGPSIGISPLLLSIEGKYGDQINGVIIRINNNKPYSLTFAGGSTISSTSKIFFFALNTAMIESISKAKNITLTVTYTPLYSDVEHFSSKLIVRDLDDLRYHISILQSLRPFIDHDDAYLFTTPSFDAYARTKERELMQKNKEDKERLNKSIAPVILPPKSTFHIHGNPTPYQQPDDENTDTARHKNKLSTTPIGIH